jgi:hypothetical protein
MHWRLGRMPDDVRWGERRPLDLPRWVGVFFFSLFEQGFSLVWSSEGLGILKNLCL